MTNPPMRQSYKPDRVEVELTEERKASWETAGGRAVKGTEYLYTVKDANFRSLNSWTVAVRVPKSVFGDIIVQPVSVPGKKVWAGLDRKAIVLVRATKNPYRSLVYCKINLADPTGEQNKRGTRWGDRDGLPRWFDKFRWRMRVKNTVTTTRGTDSWAQVVLVDREDHARMIRLYFALKVWVLQEGFILEHQ